MRTTIESTDYREQHGHIGILFFFFAAALIYGVLFLGIPISQGDPGDRQRRDFFLLAVGLLGIIGAVTSARLSVRSREDRIMIWTAAALPAYALFQVLPLPVVLVNILSPARGELLRALVPLYGAKTFATLSITPSATFTHFLLFTSYSILFLAAREFAIRASTRIWIVASPLVLVGAVEAAMGLAQFSAGNNTPVKGTYGITNHLAGLLEMTLPLAAMFGFAGLQNARWGGGRWLGPAAGWVLAALLLAGALCTLSRGGFVSILASIVVMTALAAGRNLTIQRRLAITTAAALLGLVALFYVTPVSMVARLSQHSSEGRVALWREALGIVRSYPLVGCGLGGFESAFLKFKSTEVSFIVDYAHNDYLQMLAELGIAGFVLEIVLIGAVVLRSARLAAEDSQVRWFALACLGSLTAILIHSMVDFNLYVVANAAVFAWICGMAGGLIPARPESGRRRISEDESILPHRSRRYR